MCADIAAAQATLADLTGQAPRFFRPTAGLRNPLLDPVLAGLDLQLATWTRRPYDTRDSDPQRVARRLTTRSAPGDILLPHDGNFLGPRHRRHAGYPQRPACVLQTSPNKACTRLH